MTWQVVPFTPLLSAAGVVALLAAAFLWGRHRTPSGTALTVVLVAAAGWTLATAVEHAQADLAGKLLAARVGYVFLAALPVAWVVFTGRFSTRPNRLNRRMIAALCVVPAITVVSAWTSPATGLLWRDAGLVTTDGAASLSVSYGPLFVLHAAYSYVLLAAGGVAVGRRAALTTDSDAVQGAVVLVAVFAPWLAHTVALLGLAGPWVDPTPVATALSGALLTGVVTRYDLLDAPEAAKQFARETAVDEISDALFVLTEDGTVTDCNTAATTLFEVDRDDVLGRSLSAVAPVVADAVDGASAESAHAVEPLGRDHGADPTERSEHVVYQTDRGDRTLAVRVSSFARSGLEGDIVTVRDVTQSYRHRRRMSVLNRILRHDLRNDMNVVIGYAEMLEAELATHEDIDAVPGGDGSGTLTGDGGTTAIDNIRNAAEGMLDLSSLVREVEATIDAEGAKPTRLDGAGLVRAQVDGLEFAWPEARVSVDAPDEAWLWANDLVDSAFENLLENAVEHNHREHPTVDITVRTEGDRVVTTISDDGPGIPQQELDPIRARGETQLTHSSGMGLWLVVWLVEESGGDVSFDVDETGTTVTVRLPAADPPSDPAGQA